MRLRHSTWAVAFLSLAALAQELTVDHFAERLLAASAEERRLLVDANSNLITSELVREILKLGHKFDTQSKYPEGLEAERFVFSLAKRIGDRELEESSLHGMGYYYGRLGRLEEAAESFKRAIAIAEDLNNRLRVARHSIELSTTLARLGEDTESLRYANKALDLAVAEGDLTEEARARNAAGRSHFEVGRFAEAMDQFLKALEIAEHEHLATGIAYLANNLGALYADQGNFPQALRYYERSLKIKEELKDPNLCTTLMNLGKVYHGLGRDGEALKSLERGLRLARELGNKPFVAESLTMFARVERDQRKYLNASQHLKEAATIAVEIKAREQHAQTLLEIAKTQLAAGQPKEALETSLQSVASLRSLHDNPNLGRALETAGDAALRMGQRQSARAYYLETIQCYDKAREQAAGGAEDRELFFEGMLAPYHGVARIDAGAGQIASAFEFVERAKARVLAEVLESGHTSVTRSMTLNEQIREKKLRSEMRLAVAGKPRDAARLDYQAFQNLLYTRHPELRVHRVKADPLPTSRAASVLPDNHTALLQYLVTADETLLFTVTRDRGIRLFRIRVSEQQLMKRVEAYREMVSLKDLNYQDAARELYRLMVAPAAAELAGLTSVVILPDGPLWQLPFQTLTAIDGRFLAEICQISYAPSVTVLASLIQHKKSRVAGLRLLAMAQGLPEAEDEARALGSLYGDDARIYTGAAAREAVFKSQAPGFGILHLASHGVLENSSPMYSYITLGKDASEDGRLEAAELMNMDLKARLVVLSACDTARGRIGAGEGVLGLTWALAVAGVPTTVASGWKVDSKRTADLMIGLHRGLQSGLSPAAALRQSAMKLMAQPEYRHPFYWGSFAVFGLGW